MTLGAGGLEAKAIKPTQCRRCAQIEPLNAMASVESHGPEPGSTRRSSASTAGASARRAPPAGRPAGGSIEPSSNAAVAPRWNSGRRRTSQLAAAFARQATRPTSSRPPGTKRRDGVRVAGVGAAELEGKGSGSSNSARATRTYVKGGEGNWGRDRIAGRCGPAVATRIATKAAAVPNRA